MQCKLQALVYNILPPNTAIIDYRQFSIGAQMEVSLQQTTQIISDASFITTGIAYISRISTKIVLTETELVLYVGWTCLVFTLALHHLSLIHI